MAASPYERRTHPGYDRKNAPGMRTGGRSGGKRCRGAARRAGDDTRFRLHVSKDTAEFKEAEASRFGIGMSFSQPYYPASDMFRLLQKDTGLQLDFMSRLHGVRSFESLRSRSCAVVFGGAAVQVADLKDIIRSKRALGRAKDLAILVFPRKRKMRKKSNPKRPISSRSRALEALEKELDRAEREQIRALLALPMNRRTHFLRVRLPNGGSCL